MCPAESGTFLGTSISKGVFSIIVPTILHHSNFFNFLPKQIKYSDLVLSLGLPEIALLIIPIESDIIEAISNSSEVKALVSFSETFGIPIDVIAAPV